MKLSNAKTLFLCRTPFQAKICLRIIDKLNIDSFDIIYITTNNSDSDKSYYTEISEKSEKSLYLYMNWNRFSMISDLAYISKLYLSHREHFNRYSYIYIASIDNFLFRYIVKKNPSAVLSGFDDGTANITPSSVYYNLDVPKRKVLYSKLLGIKNESELRDSLEIHYSVYLNFDNYIDINKVKFLSLLSQELNDIDSNNKPMITFFIGQPFQEYLINEELVIMKQWLENERIDYYIMHPREKKPLLDDIPLIKKDGWLAEDIILNSTDFFNPRVISGYSTVLFNLSCLDITKVYLSLRSTPEEIQRCALIKRTGSKIVHLS